MSDVFLTLLVVTLFASGCCPDRPVNLALAMPDYAEAGINSCAEKGIPVSEAQLIGLIGRPDHSVNWDDYQKMLKAEADLPDEDIIQQKKHINRLGERRLHTDKDITGECTFYIYYWDHPHGIVDRGGLFPFPRELKGTRSLYYVVYHGSVLGASSIVRREPEHGE